MALTWVMQNAVVWRVVQDDESSAPARSHIGLQGGPEQREVPRENNEDCKVPVREGHGCLNGLPHHLGQVGQQYLCAVHV